VGQKVIPRPSADYFVVGRRQKCKSSTDTTTRYILAGAPGAARVEFAIDMCYGICAICLQNRPRLYIQVYAESELKGAVIDRAT
jgi:hypothetical protein